MARKHAFVNRQPTNMAPNAPKDAVKAEFGRRLQHRIAELGWNQSELGRRAEAYLPDGEMFGRDNVSGYIRGLSLPGPVKLRALAQALDCEIADLIPSSGVPSVDNRHPPLEVKDSGDGRAWIRINQAVDWPVALQIMKLIKGD